MRKLAARTLLSKWRACESTMQQGWDANFVAKSLTFQNLQTSCSKIFVFISFRITFYLSSCLSIINKRSIHNFQTNEPKSCLTLLVFISCSEKCYIYKMFPFFYLLFLSKIWQFRYVFFFFIIFEKKAPSASFKKWRRYKTFF